MKFRSIERALKRNHLVAELSPIDNKTINLFRIIGKKVHRGGREKSKVYKFVPYPF
jgi:hypothetical protein